MLLFKLARWYLFAILKKLRDYFRIGRALLTRFRMYLIVATRYDRKFKKGEVAPAIRCSDKGEVQVKVLHKNKTGNVKQGYSQTGSVFSTEDAIAPTLDVAAGRLFKVPKKKDEKEKDH